MCAQYLIKSSVDNLARFFGVSVSVEDIWSERVLPQSLAPVITEDGMKLMKFSLLPSWSKDPKVKFATHNARLETISEKATWKKPFLKNHCLVPISTFIEPIYTGQFAGNMVGFEAHELLVAAGIFDHWVNKETGEVIESFAIITSDPSEFISKVGHDRQPVFLNPKKMSKWIGGGGESFTAVKELLDEVSFDPELNVEIDRPLKPGWEKRVSAKS
jgi:putative SOS response-associated peptidase YedK